MKKIIIVADASIGIGSGHVMRCLTIAHGLVKQRCQVKFLMNDLPGNLIEFVKNEGFINIPTYEQADLYIIDHYKIGIAQEREIRKFSKKIMIVDDLANREHDCDLLLDQNVMPHFKTRYDLLVKEKCIKLLGPKYLIMREEFIQSRHKRIIEGVKHVLVFMGGSDPTAETLKVLEALRDFSFAHIDVVVGNGNIHKEEIKQICEERCYAFHQQINYMADLMKKADFSLGAGGSTTWERCYVGLPSACTIVADNQRIGTAYAAELGACISLGWHEQVTVETYRDVLHNLSISKLQTISDTGLEITANKQSNQWLYEILELIR
ncbi:UDP-2,4-diacetamido-2,4,6-trideoxy-beta-L-altropyranose hydrolase [Lysinibacillus fusiformis]|uniref:UDP-2,4-diacetamido-2,4, 6-trideoxy-beta-L-altropyranose hydrolase n=1 Tax=Lysinibacillus fusiformis TaxID=28031 RepID=UPI0018E5C7F8|nr:UDP-2,4-diacetamido-2,4,6-trideoxy-beta-L-altropyranose hydrolase [Lysinibacillus fusiformis]MBI6865913.1 UDP-2,4-diacetamido-2,4,6-trideoxy-beta-L-altropyranose hydrolase [Lysinibacillus fusiformis]